MSQDRADARPVPGDHPDRIRWNARYAAGFEASFTPHPLAVRALSMDLPDGPVADLACGLSGSALRAAAHGRQVTAVDVSEVALGLLGDEARRRGLGHLITLVHADLSAWSAEPRSHALVLCTGFWDTAVFTAATGAVADGGLLAWEAFTAEARRARPSLPPQWCLAPGEPASLLPPDFTLVDQSDESGRERRQMLARRASPIRCVGDTGSETGRAPVAGQVRNGAGQVAEADWRCAHSVMSRRSMAAARSTTAWYGWAALPWHSPHTAPEAPAPEAPAVGQARPDISDWAARCDGASGARASTRSRSQRSATVETLAGGTDIRRSPGDRL
jgi:hypothetical protein